MLVYMLIGLIVGCTLGIIITSFAAASKISDLNYKLWDVKQELEKIKKENAVLKYEGS